MDLHRILCTFMIFMFLFAFSAQESCGGHTFAFTPGFNKQRKQSKFFFTNTLCFFLTRARRSFFRTASKKMVSKDQQTSTSTRLQTFRTKMVQKKMVQMDQESSTSTQLQTLRTRVRRDSSITASRKMVSKDQQTFTSTRLQTLRTNN